MVTGIGGIFIKAKDPRALAEWYQKHLGISFGKNNWVDFKWINENDPAVAGNTVFSFFNEHTDYFNPSAKQYMINFRVKNLDQLLDQLKKESVWVAERTEEYEYGKFGWIMDPEGNKIELWEPVDKKL